MQIKKQHLELDMRYQPGSKVRKEYVKALYCHPAYLTYTQSRVHHEKLDVLHPAGLDEAQAGIKIARRNINNLRYTDDANFMAEREEELESLLRKVKEEGEKAGLKPNIDSC